MNTQDYERARSALGYISPDDRSTWVRIGMAIKDGFGDEGFDLWDRWSRQSDRYVERDARDVWKSIKRGGGITLATLFHEATVNGWRDDETRPTPEELEARRRQASERNAKEEAEKVREHAEAARKASALWTDATSVREAHPYLVHKGVSPVPSLREIDAGAAAALLGYAPKYRDKLDKQDKPLVGRLLVVPVKVAGKLSTLELIDEGGHKSVLSRSRKSGGFWAAQLLPKGDGTGITLMIAEGVVTALSAREATGYLVIAALSDSNLPKAAKAMRERYPKAVLVILVDLVKATGDPDPHAIEAARAVAGLVVIPDFGEARLEGLKDFNDLATLRGLEAVQSAIASAKAPDGDGARHGNGAASGVPSFITAATLWDMQHDPTCWAVPGIIPEGVTILGGKPKVGKSWLALDVALAVGTGGLALGAIEVEAGAALYLALEDTKRRLTKRLRILCGNTTPPPQQIEFLTDCPRLGSGGEEVLRVWLRDHPTARLIVIDTLPRFRPPGNAKETPYANDYVVGQYLSRLCVEHQVSILVLGHLRKQPGDDPIDEISGTLGLVGSVDGYMVLRRQAMSDEATLYVCGRDVDDPAEHCIVWDRASARWRITGGDPRVSRLPAEQRRAYELLSEAPKNAKELTEALNPGHVVTDPTTDTRRRAAAAIAHKLLEKGLIARRTFDGRWAPINTHTTTTSNTTTTRDARDTTANKEVVGGISGIPGSRGIGGACPSCAGEGCDWCGGMGRIVDDEPEEMRP